MSSENILVIKHGALGDIVLATAGFSAIRSHHPHAHITCLTSKPYAELLKKSPYFDDVWVDAKPKLFNRQGIAHLRAMLNSKPWAWIYDLQTSKRTTTYEWLLKRPWPNISNVSRWSSHGYTDVSRYQKHALEQIVIQLFIAGIRDVGVPDISWMNEPLGLGLKEAVAQESSIAAKVQPFALLVPGGAAHRPQKRWPAEHYAALAKALAEHGVRPVLIGTNAEAEALASIAEQVPAAINLCGCTTIEQLATLAREAALAVGNDTGPMHVIAASHCPALVLFSSVSDPARSAPVGDVVRILREADLRDLAIAKVMEIADAILAQGRAVAD